jgi:hypothetical protein
MQEAQGVLFNFLHGRTNDPNTCCAGLKLLFIPPNFFLAIESSSHVPYHGYDTISRHYIYTIELKTDPTFLQTRHHTQTADSSSTISQCPIHDPNRR